MDLVAYLERIHYDGPLQPTAATLSALHRAHLLTVPFENLDIHLGNSIRLEEDALLDKIVRRRRGGYCFELNGLFAALLRSLGYRVSVLNSLIPETHNGCGLAFDHPILLVELEERWIADVGFGDPYRLPLRLDERGEQDGVGATYRISAEGETGWKFWQRLEHGEWEFYYAFTLEPCRLSDFAEANHFYETSPLSGFTHKRICSRATLDGCVSLSDDNLIITRQGRREESPLAGEADFALALHEHFEITLDQPFPRSV